MQLRPAGAYAPPRQFGDVFTYTYDAVGNRLTQTTLTATNVYTYDAANRLVNVDGLAQTWDNNGNLLSGAGYTYTYDSANRLVTLQQGATLTYTIAYNGQEDRVSLAVNGVPTTYTLDLNAGLVQILVEGSTTYLYGTSRLAQSTGTTTGTALDGVFDDLRLDTGAMPGPSGPSATPTPTATPTATATATPGASATPTVTATSTPPPTNTATPTATNTPSATPTAGGGGVITVNSVADELTTDGDCSLREAVRAANLNTAIDACPAGGSAPVIHVPAGTYPLSLGPAGDDAALQGDLDLTHPVTLNGAGADLTIISGETGWSDRIFHVLAAGVQTGGVTIQNGNSGASSGGGLRSEAGAALTLSGVAVVSNTTSANGGGILTSGVLTMTDSAVLNNTSASAGGGGGLYISSGTVTLSNVTLSGNTAHHHGGGIRAAGALTLTNVTLTNNTADSDANEAGDGGGLVQTSGATVNVQNTLIAGNVDNSGTTPRADCWGTFTSQGNNLIGNNTGCTGFTPGVNGDQVGTGGSPLDPQVGALGDNGGATLTHALLTGSPAIDAGTNVGCPATDQRGYTRDAACDIGAYEYGASGAAGGATLSSALDTSSIQLARLPTSPRGVGDAPVIAALALLDPPPVTEIVTKTYYYAGSSLIAMRVLTGTMGNTLYYLHSDHLGSTSLTTNVTGAVVARQYYYPYGDVRAGDDLPTDIGFTGQRAESGLGSLMYFNARMYSPLIGRFLSADSIVPNPANPQSLNRYSYVLNRPLVYIDPSGHTYLCNEACEDDYNWSPPKDPIPLTSWGQKMNEFCEGFYGGACTMDNAQDLMARVLTREFTGIEFGRRDPNAQHNIELLEHSTTHAVYTKCAYENGGRSCSGITTNAILNWLGGYSSVAKSMYNGGRVPQAISPLAREVTESIFNPPNPEWTKAAYIDTEPGSWGNESLYKIPNPDKADTQHPFITVGNFLRANGYGAPQWEYGTERTFYVLTVAQTRVLQQYRVP